MTVLAEKAALGLVTATPLAGVPAVLSTWQGLIGNLMEQWESDLHP